MRGRLLRALAIAGSTLGASPGEFPRFECSSSRDAGGDGDAGDCDDGAGCNLKVATCSCDWVCVCICVCAFGCVWLSALFVCVCIVRRFEHMCVLVCVCVFLRWLCVGVFASSLDAFSHVAFMPAVIWHSTIQDHPFFLALCCNRDCGTPSSGIPFLIWHFVAAAVAVHNGSQHEGYCGVHREIRPQSQRSER